MMKFWLLLLLPIFSMHATERAPWYPKNLELDAKAAFSYQTYHTLNTVHGFAHKPAYNQFLDLSLSGAYTNYAVEIETLLAKTRHRTWGVADIALTGRYQWMDDVIGDPYSLTTGLTLTQVFKQALHDVSCFYHGGIEFELHAALGKECICREFWQSRYWGVVGLGFADIGSPWLRANAYWEMNWWDLQEIQLSLESLWGFGGEGLHLHKHFHGYGPIHHQSIDMGLAYQRTFECGGIVSIGYTRRLYALNCPRCVNTWTVSYLYPFGLGL